MLPGIFPAAGDLPSILAEGLKAAKIPQKSASRGIRLVFRLHLGIACEDVLFSASPRSNVTIGETLHRITHLMK
jgi:hypothetical protein